MVRPNYVLGWGFQWITYWVVLYMVSEVLSKGGKVDLKWLHAPGHSRSIGPNVIQLAVNLDPVVIDWSEMNHNVDDLVATAKGYLHFIGPPKRTDARGRVVNHDVIISVRKGVTITHQEEFFVGREIPVNLKYMPERWGKAIVFWFEGQTILLVAWHPQPNPLRWMKLVLPQYRRSVRRVEEIQARLEKEFAPDIVLNGGDLQLGPGNRWVHPNKLAARHDMLWQRHKIDWQMYKGFGLKLIGFKTIDPSTVNPGMDHMWTEMTLRKAT